MKKLIRITALLIPAGLWLCLYLLWSRELQENLGAELSWSSPSLSWEELSAARAKESAGGGIHFFLWEEKEAAAEHPETGRRTAVRMRSGRGELEQAYGCRLASGGFPAADDESGCLVSRPVAEAVWGGTDVIGKKLLAGEEAYFVRGVTEEKKKLVYVISREEGRSFSRLFSCFGPESAVQEAVSTQKALVREFLSRHDLTQPDSVTDCRWEGEIRLTVLRLLLILVTAVWVWKWEKRKRASDTVTGSGGSKGSASESERAWKKRIFHVAYFIVLFSFIWFWGFRDLTIPEDWIPPAWSDFSFWSGKLREWKEAGR